MRISKEVSVYQGDEVAKGIDGAKSAADAAQQAAEDYYTQFQTAVNITSEGVEVGKRALKSSGEWEAVGNKTVTTNGGFEVRDKADNKLLTIDDDSLDVYEPGTSNLRAQFGADAAVIGADGGMQTRITSSQVAIGKSGEAQTLVKADGIRMTVGGEVVAAMGARSELEQVISAGRYLTGYNVSNYVSAEYDRYFSLKIYTPGLTANKTYVWHITSTISGYSFDSNIYFTPTAAVSGGNYLRIWASGDAVEVVADSTGTTAATASYICRRGDTSLWTEKWLYVDRIQAVEGAILPQKVLWSGAWHMSASQSVDLSEPVSAQATGIVLVWSYYTDKTVRNYFFNTQFIPRQAVEMACSVLGAAEAEFSAFLTGRSKFGTPGFKNVFVADDHITGHADNIASGTWNGITYNSSNWVLRWVIGV